MPATPRLTLGVPVYNGENYLREALDALLAQTYSDFELIISDNASTDGTADICQEYAARDRRIRYLRQPENIGASRNHDFLVRQAGGELFKWAAHDDLFAPELVERCVAALDRRPDVVLAHSWTGTADEHGSVAEKFEYALATNSPSAPERFRSLLFTDGGDDYYGVIRTDVLRQVAPHDSYHHAGRKLVAELTLHGRFHQVPEVLFLRREHPGRGDLLGSVRAVCGNLDPRRRGQSSARLVGEYVASYLPAIRRAPLSSADRRRCYAVYLSWLADRTAGRRLAGLRRAA